MMGRNSKTSSLINKEFRASIGNGFNADIWSHSWTGRRFLKIIFLRIFALVRVKEGPVANFGHWIMGSGKWKVELRRWTFDLEIEVWDDLSEILNGVYMDDNVTDQIVWTPKLSGVFSYKYFRRKMTSVASTIPTWKEIWSIDVPTKVKTFMWLLLRGRLPVRDKIFSLNHISA